MDTSLGRITAQLLQNKDNFSPELVDLINQNINPPSPIGKDDVYIRAMYIVSDQINSFGGCFPVEEHSRLAELLVDSPVMVGHRKDRLPIARNFFACPEEKDSRQWIKSYFYWLKSARGAEDLIENIDGGIYKECSIGFTYLFPECSVCGRDIRQCEHEPFGEYQHGGKTVPCHFNYRRIERVLETSLVYRGALPDTAISRELKIEKKNDAGLKKTVIEEISGPAEIINPAADNKYLLVPRYEAIPVAASFENNRLTLTRENGTVLAEEFAARFPLGHIKNNTEVITTLGRLVGYRGKERCRAKYLEKFLNDNTGPVTRVELKLFPHNHLELVEEADHKLSFNIRVIPHRFAGTEDLNRRAIQIMTQAGVEIWPLVNSIPTSKGYLYRPDKNNLTETANYILQPTVNEVDYHLSLNRDGRREMFVIRQFNPERLCRGKCFITDKVDDNRLNEKVSNHRGKADGHIKQYEQEGDGVRLALNGRLDGDFVLRPVKLEGRRRFLFYRLTGS